MAHLDPEAPNGVARWLILVAIDQVELYAHLRNAFREDELIEVVQSVGLRLNLRGSARVIVSRNATRSDAVPPRVPSSAAQRGCLRPSLAPAETLR